MGELNPEEFLIKSIEPKKPREFIDPFPYTEPPPEKQEGGGHDTNRQSPPVDQKGASHGTAANASGAHGSIHDEAKLNITKTKLTHGYFLGNKHIKDERGGDAGCLYKYPNAILPRCFFVRASLFAPMNSTMSHPELKA